MSLYNSENVLADFSYFVWEILFFMMALQMPMGHALIKTLKDIISRYKVLFFSILNIRYVPLYLLYIHFENINSRHAQTH